MVVILEPSSLPWTWMKSKWKKWQMQEWAYPLAQLCVEIADWQRKEGRYFIIKQPAESTLWNLKPVRWLTTKMKGLKLNWAEYKDPQKGKSPETHTYLLHNLPEGTFKPLEELPKVKISREKSRTINSIMADCLMTIFNDVIDEKQRFLVSDILDLMNEPPDTELAVSTYVKEKLNIDEGYAFPTLQDTTNPKRGTGIVADPEIIKPADICATLGTGEQVILQGNQILYRGYVYYNKYFTWAVCKPVSYTHLTLPTICSV